MMREQVDEWTMEASQSLSTTQLNKVRGERRALNGLLRMMFCVQTFSTKFE